MILATLFLLGVLLVGEAIGGLYLGRTLSLLVLVLSLAILEPLLPQVALLPFGETSGIQLEAVRQGMCQALFPLISAALLFVLSEAYLSLGLSKPIAPIFRLFRPLVLTAFLVISLRNLEGSSLQLLAAMGR